MTHNVSTDDMSNSNDGLIRNSKAKGHCPTASRATEIGDWSPRKFHPVKGAFSGAMQVSSSDVTLTLF